MTPGRDDPLHLRYFLSTFRLSERGDMMAEMVEADNETAALAAGRAAETVCAGAIVYREAEDMRGIRHVVALRAFGTVPAGINGRS
jgi:hypothetical protein